LMWAKVKIGGHWRSPYGLVLFMLLLNKGIIFFKKVLGLVSLGRRSWSPLVGANQGVQPISSYGPSEFLKKFVVNFHYVFCRIVLRNFWKTIFFFNIEIKFKVTFLINLPYQKFWKKKEENNKN
jgi:hypothetical protein